MDHRSVGTLIVGAGVVLVLVGLVAYFGGLSWFGRLPGDIRVERENVRLYVPLVSMLLLSVVLAVVVNVLRRLL